MVDQANDAFRPRQKMQAGGDTEKGSAFAIQAAETKARDDKTARLKAARLAQDAAAPKEEAPPKAKPARSNR